MLVALASVCGMRFISRSVEKLARELGRRLPGFGYFFFRLVLELRILIRRERVFRRLDSEFLQPLRVDVEPARRLTHRARIGLLALGAEEPVEKYFRGVRMGSAFDDRHIAAAAADV